MDIDWEDLDLDEIDWDALEDLAGDKPKPAPKEGEGEEEAEE